MAYVIGVVVPILFVVACLFLFRLLQRQHSVRRLFADVDSDAAALQLQTDHDTGIRRWLFLAGFRNAAALPAFWGAIVIALLAGLATSYLFYMSGIQQMMINSVSLIPGGVSEVFLPIVWLAPWLLLFFVSLMPILIVRGARRKRIEHVEKDLPLVLELLAALSEAGLGFDAALTRILKTRLADRPLANEFRTFQADLLSGRPRVECLRRFGRRLQVPGVTIFVSALVQAEQLGMGIAHVLRQQADDLRMRRRERATAFANALPVKRLFPLVVCFLPGLFVWTLGPVFVQLFQMADTFVRVPNF